MIEKDGTGEPVYGEVSDRKDGRIVGFTRVGMGLHTKYKDFFAFKDRLPLPDGIEVPDLYEYLKEQKGKVSVVMGIPFAK